MSKPTKPEPIPILAMDPVAMKAMKKGGLYKTYEAGATEEPSSNDESAGILEMLLKSVKAHEASQRMSFEVDPQTQSTSYGNLYRQKINLVPDGIIKKITGTQGDDLVCQILQARANIMASFGRPRTSRFSVGFEFVEVGDRMPEDEKKKEELQARLEGVKEFLSNCGGKDSIDANEYFKPSLSQFLKMTARDAVAHGRLACERIYTNDLKTGKRKLAAFRPVDAGTIYHIIPKREQEQATRQEAIRMLAELRNEKIDIGRFEKDEYRWVQVINGKPVQTFTADELVVYNFYPTNNVEYNGYPLTPIDQSLNAIVTHINITLHNKLYFQHGRAARGMLVLQSDDADEALVQQIKNQFHQSINSVQNAWRMPVFGVGAEDKLSWTAIDVAGRDQEFASLMDNNARVILSAFQMSPEELPGYAHLARGTNTQALAEADNEWKLTAARDVGLRPLIYDMQDFFNYYLLPEIDPEIAQYYKIAFAGLEQDSPEKEAIRISQDMPLHMTMNDILDRVEKDPIDKQLGGDVPLNPQFHQLVLSPYMTVGEILANFFGRPEAAKDPRFAYVRDPFWIQYQQLILQKTQMAMQNQMMAQQAMAQQQPEPPPQAESAPPDADEAKKSEVAARNLQKREQWVAQNYTFLEKTIQNNHSEITKAILARHKQLVDAQLDKWKAESKEAVSKILSAIEGKKDEA
jgi:hypothetical protein